MYQKDTIRERFSNGGLETASASRVLVMAFERLDRDLLEATTSIEAGKMETAHQALIHAQDLVSELRLMLDVDAWEHASSLASIYQFVWTMLVEANVQKSVPRINQARKLLGELGRAFTTAATQSASSAAAAMPSTAVSEAPLRRLSLQA